MEILMEVVWDLNLHLNSLKIRIKEMWVVRTKRYEGLIELEGWHHSGLLKGQNHPEMEAVCSQSLQMCQPGRWDLVVSPDVLYDNCVGCSLAEGSWNRGKWGLKARASHSTVGCVPGGKDTFLNSGKGPMLASTASVSWSHISNRNGIQQTCRIRIFIISHNRKLSVDFRVGSEMSSKTQVLSVSLFCQPWHWLYPLTGHNMVAVASGIPFRWQDPEEEERPSLHGIPLEVKKFSPESSWPTLSYILLTITGLHVYS